MWNRNKKKKIRIPYEGLLPFSCILNIEFQKNKCLSGLSHFEEFIFLWINWNEKRSYLEHCLGYLQKQIYIYTHLHICQSLAKSEQLMDFILALTVYFQKYTIQNNSCGGYELKCDVKISGTFTAVIYPVIF